MIKVYVLINNEEEFESLNLKKIMTVKHKDSSNEILRKKPTNKVRTGESLFQESFLNLEKEGQSKEESKEIEEANQSIVSILNGLESSKGKKQRNDKYKI